MGSSGYVGKTPEWKKKIEEAISVDNPNPVDDIEERTVNWLLAQSELTQDGKLVHKKKGVAAVQEKGSRTHCREKNWVSSSLTGIVMFLVELSATLNTLDAFVASLFKCRG
jgi:hypothetical protein